MTATTPKELGEKGLESQAGGKVGSQMWVRMPPKHAEVYEKGIVLEASTGTKIKVQLPDNTVEEYPISDVLPCNSESDLADICALTYLSEAAVLDCIKVRFIKKKIYTWTARILIAMNPFERLTIYDDDAKAEYAKLDPRSAPPHIFAIGEHAYRSIAKKGKYTNQAIIVSGESGSGKTVGNKLLMDYFAYRSGSASTSKVTEQISRVMQDSNPPSPSRPTCSRNRVSRPSATPSATTTSSTSCWWAAWSFCPSSSSRPTWARTTTSTSPPASPSTPSTTWPSTS